MVQFDGGTFEIHGDRFIQTGSCCSWRSGNPASLVPRVFHFPASTAPTLHALLGGEMKYSGNEGNWHFFLERAPQFGRDTFCTKRCPRLGLAFFITRLRGGLRKRRSLISGHGTLGKKVSCKRHNCSLDCTYTKNIGSRKYVSRRRWTILPQS